MQINNHSARSRLSSKRSSGIMVRLVPKKSCFYRAGIRPRDRIVMINGEPVRDELDFRFFAADNFLEIEIVRNDRHGIVEIERESGDFLAIEFFEKPICRCTNRCIFCFIDQMPKGLRHGLYIKDEDLTHSFLNGNYVTLSNCREPQLQKIVKIGLSPLFISVHATDPATRAVMLGNSRAPDIMEQLRFLQKNSIAVHTQIVVCPGYNDGAVLVRTVTDLLGLKSSLLSIAIVPVGLTRFRTFFLEPMSEENARAICEKVGGISDHDFLANGSRRIFLADELFIRAKLPIPKRSYYEDYPQIENGVGLVRQLLEDWRSLKRSIIKGVVLGKNRKKHYLCITSISAYSYINKMLLELCSLTSLRINVVPVENHFFGTAVTVAGLLSARDVVRVVLAEKKNAEFDGLVLPQVMFNYAGFTLDGYSSQRLAKLVKLPVKVVSSLKEILET